MPDRLPALPYVRSGVTQGLSANKSYEQYQAEAHEQGLVGMRRQDYLRLHSETLSARGTTAKAIGAPKESVPDVELQTPISFYSKHRYLSQVMVYQRTRGETDLIASPWLIGSEELLTPEEAERQVGESIAQGEREYDRTVLGIGYVGTYVPNQ